MNFHFYRRKFFQSTLLLGTAIPLSHALGKSADLPHDCFFYRDIQGCLRASLGSNFNASQILLQPGAMQNGLCLNEPHTYPIFVLDVQQKQSPFVLFIGHRENRFYFQVVCFSFGLELQDLSLENSYEFNSHSIDEEGRPLLNLEDEFSGAVAQDARLFLLFRRTSHDLLKIIICDATGHYNQHTIPDFSFPFGAMFSLLPAGLFGEKNLCFFVANQNTKSHQFYELCESQESNAPFAMSLLCELSHGQEIHPQWQFFYSTEHPYYKNWNPKGDRHVCVMQCAPEENHVLQYQKHDGTLVALSFTCSEGVWLPSAKAVSADPYHANDFHFYGTIFDAERGSDVLLVQKRSEEMPFVIELFCDQFRVIPVDLSQEDSIGSTELKRYFSHGNSNISLIAASRREENPWCAVKLLRFTGCDENSDVHSIPFSMKFDDGVYLFQRSTEPAGKSVLQMTNKTVAGDGDKHSDSASEPQSEHSADDDAVKKILESAGPPFFVVGIIVCMFFGVLRSLLNEDDKLNAKLKVQKGTLSPGAPQILAPQVPSDISHVVNFAVAFAKQLLGCLHTFSASFEGRTDEILPRDHIDQLLLSPAISAEIRDKLIGQIDSDLNVASAEHAALSFQVVSDARISIEQGYTQNIFLLSPYTCDETEGQPQSPYYKIFSGKLNSPQTQLLFLLKGGFFEHLFDSVAKQSLVDTPLITASQLHGPMSHIRQHNTLGDAFSGLINKVNLCLSEESAVPKFDPSDHEFLYDLMAWNLSGQLVE